MVERTSKVHLITTIRLGIISRSDARHEDNETGHTKGITDIPTDIDFNEFKTNLMTNPLVRDVTKTKSGHAAVTFLANSTPTATQLSHLSLAF